MKRRNGPKKPVTLDGICFDALLSQDKVFEAQVPDYPVESGYKVQDGILPNPLSVSTTLFLSNTPVTWKSRIGVSRTRVKTVEARLEQVYWNREPITYITSDQTFENMVIESMTISKTEEDGYSRRIPITLKQVDITETQTGVVPDSYVRGCQTEASAGTASVSSDNSGVATSTASGSKSTSSSSGSSKKTDEKKNSEEKASILYKAGKGLGLIK